jgi:hypothetical protein
VLKITKGAFLLSLQEVRLKLVVFIGVSLIGGQLDGEGCFMILIKGQISLLIPIIDLTDF